MLKHSVWIFALAAVCLLCGCGPSEKTKIDVNTKEYETDYLKVTAQTVEFKGLSDTAFESRLNDEYQTQVYQWITDFDSEAQANASAQKMGEKYVFELTQKERYNKNNFISIVSESYLFTGGAHGSSGWVSKNIDVAENKEVTLADLFTDPDYQTQLNRKLTECVTKNPQEYQDLWEQPVLGEAQQKDFYIENGKLVIYYQPYELSYYARGVVEFPIKLEELESYMNPLYRKLAT